MFVGSALGDEGMLQLTEMLPRCKIAAVELDGNGISDAGARMMAAVLPHAVITTLALSNNGLGPPTALALASALGTCRISVLDISYNQIGDRGLSGSSTRYYNNHHARHQRKPNWGIRGCSTSRSTAGLRCKDIGFALQCNWS